MTGGPGPAGPELDLRDVDEGVARTGGGSGDAGEGESSVALGSFRVPQGVGTGPDDPFTDSDPTGGEAGLLNESVTAPVKFLCPLSGPW